VIIYPEPMLVARHPAVLFTKNPEEQAAARRWIHFLLSKEMQEKAIDFGFRPANPDVSIRAYNVEQNRFLRLRRYGVLVQSRWVEAPRADGSLVQDLIALWGEVTGRN
jgi:ABC-type sulfate transport system substrate-binding protein